MKPGDRVLLKSWADEYAGPHYPRAGEVYVLTHVYGKCVRFTDETGNVIGITAVSCVQPVPKFFACGSVYTELCE